MARRDWASLLTGAMLVVLATAHSASAELISNGISFLWSYRICHLCCPLEVQ